VGGDHTRVNLKEIEVRQLLVHQVLNHRRDVDETAAIQIEIAHQLVVDWLSQLDAIFIFKDSSELSRLNFGVGWRIYYRLAQIFDLVW